MITQDRLKELFDYHPDGGLIHKTTLRSCKGDRVKVGSIRMGYSLGKKWHKYRQMSVDGHNYRFHRLIYLWHHGSLPKYIDHADRNPSNNRIDNLREATHSQNMANCMTTNKFGYKGVAQSKNAPTFIARITHNYKNIYLGRFVTREEAAKAYDKKAKELFGDFAVLNFSQ